MGLPTKNIIQLNRYFDKTLRHIFSSQFVLESIYEFPKINKIGLSIKTKKIKKTHFLFIYLLSCGKRPHLIKYNIPKKFKSQVSRVTKNSYILLRLSGITAERTLHRAIFEIFPQIFSSERPAIRINKCLLDLLITKIPLMEESLALQSANGYLANIPLTITLNMPYTTFYQKIFVANTLKLYAREKSPSWSKIPAGVNL